MGKILPRKLVAIFYADVAGYSRLTGEDEDATHLTLTEYLDYISSSIESHNGKVMHYAGDAVLAMFDAVVNAISAAVAIQNELRIRNEKVPEDSKIQFRIGVNTGDVIEDRGDIYGDGVNVAARLEALSNPGGICISDAVRSAVGKKLNLTYEDIGEQEVKNISEPVRSYKILMDWEKSSIPVDITTAALELPDKPSIAVLQFINLSNDTEQDYFADGIVDSITTALSRIKTFFVIARTSAFIFKDQAVTFAKVRDVLGVRYFLEGSVQKVGNRVRINVQLIETTSGAHVWADQYDGALSDIFDLQDKIIEQVAGALHPNILQAEIDRSRRKPPQDLGAYDYVMRSMSFVWALNQNDNQEAIRLLKLALEIDPNYPLALSLMAWCHGQQAIYNWSLTMEETRAETLRLAKLAASLNGDDPLVLTVLGAAYSIINDHKSAKVLLERAVSLDPNSSWAWIRLGWTKCYSELPKEAIEHFEAALRLSPYDPMNFNCYIGIGTAYEMAREYDKSIPYFERGLNENPEAIWAYRQLVPAYMEAGRREEAENGVRLLLQTYPNITATKVRLAMVLPDAEMSWICSNLVKAGLPE
jgi:adenylate cyclase